MAVLESVALVSLVGGVAALASGARLNVRNNAADAALAHCLALRDGMTGVASGQGFITEVQDRLADGEPVSVLWIGLAEANRLVGFYGDVAMETVLRAVAARISGCCAAEDLVARWDTETFAVVTAETSPSVLLDRMAELRQEIAGPQMLDGGMVNAWAFAGAVICQDGWTFDDILLRAVAAASIAEDGDGVALWADPAPADLAGVAV